MDHVRHLCTSTPERASPLTPSVLLSLTLCLRCCPFGPARVHTGAEWIPYFLNRSHHAEGRRRGWGLAPQLEQGEVEGAEINAEVREGGWVRRNKGGRGERARPTCVQTLRGSHSLQPRASTTVEHQHLVVEVPELGPVPDGDERYTARLAAVEAPLLKIDWVERQRVRYLTARPRTCR